MIRSNNLLNLVPGDLFQLIYLRGAVTVVVVVVALAVLSDFIKNNSMASGAKHGRLGVIFRPSQYLEQI